MTVVYGIRSCDSCRAALKHFKNSNIEASLHDFRTDGLDVRQLERWCDAFGWEKLLNRRSLTWRKIPAADRDGIDRERAIALMLENPTLVKRPVLEHEGRLALGFSRDSFSSLTG